MQSGSHNVFVNGLSAFRVTDKNTPHGFTQGDLATLHIIHYHKALNVFVNGLP